jgi:hypothetical protein
MRKRHTALLLVEGFTEERFYSAIAQRFFPNAAKRIKNLRGNLNLNAKVADAAVQFAQNHPGKSFDVYVCVDQERIGPPPFNKRLVEEQLHSLPHFRKIIPVIAVLMIESLFFIDIDGIYHFLRTPRSQRKPHRFRQFRRLRHQDLTTLFARYSKRYQKGERCNGLVRSLDLDAMVSTASELTRLVDSVRKRSEQL